MTKNKSLEETLFVYFGSGNELHTKQDYAEAKEEILQSLLSLIGQDEKIRWDDYKDNVALSQAKNKVRAELRKLVREWVNRG